MERTDDHKISSFNVEIFSGIIKFEIPLSEHVSFLEWNHYGAGL